MSKPKILILGAGYGGLMTAKGLQKGLSYNEAEVTLVNQNPYHYVTTKLHEPAAGTLHHDYTRVPISSVLDERKVRFVQDRVTAVDREKKVVTLENSNEGLAYDYLVMAMGSAPETFGIQGLLENAYFIRNINSVRMIREHIEYQFSQYHLKGERQDLVTIVVGGAGFTGIEFVGELVDRIPQLCRDYDIPQNKVRLVNVEAAPTALPGFDKDLVEYATNYLESRGVEFKIGIPIESCSPEGVVLKGGEEVKAATVVWTGGVRGNKVVEESGVETMRGRVKVDEFLRAPGHEDIFVIGDSSLIINEEIDRPYPPTAQMATQQGEWLGRNLPLLMRGGDVKPYEFDMKGTLASLGRNEAIGMVGTKKMFGSTPAFLKRANDLRWFYKLGGISMVLRKGKL
ncbi:NAD(P)/FAD-dependent oxidoreductase [Mechercharimyces sp. CAU 1602]|uniref:NAD(P)/FAD-dependent oxidoreductase n=1 Tax=Mechercharimyces sp. CAU 1602 TaxID=2973933 RepID=UPI0021629766|nr:NAD(P)/FAD-dependent oxidoreductase [Mechercharimyces sp. CAU 1602]MCS1351757.1 NAD(P)/FAD-dependent oxidoreductase [Mechercharimyces sp. CAU 1602]